MYAIVDIQGQQFKLEKDAKVYVHRLEGEEGAKVDFDKVLLVDDNGSITVGAPNVAGMTVSATILSHLKDKKVQVFKKKRRKGYQKQNGHRQYLTQVQITSIGGAAPKKAAKKEAAPKAETEAPAEGQ
jgi:large subunit ribosomal protein L21